MQKVLNIIFHCFLMDKTFTLKKPFYNFVRMFDKITLISLPPRKNKKIEKHYQQKRFCVFRLAYFQGKILVNIFKEANSCYINHENHENLIRMLLKTSLKINPCGFGRVRKGSSLLLVGHSCTYVVTLKISYAINYINWFTPHFFQLDQLKIEPDLLNHFKVTQGDTHWWKQ